MTSVHELLLESIERRLKAALDSEGRVILTVKTETPKNDQPLTCLFRKIDPAVRIPLGFACKLPDGYCALILSRSSTWEKWGLCLGNQLGLVDGSYCGDNDEWQLLTYRPNSYKNYPATIPAGTRICQFILARTAPDLNFEIVDSLPDPSRGGFGSTGE